MTCWWIWHIWFCYMCLFPDYNLVAASSNMPSQRIIAWWHVGDTNICIVGKLPSLPHLALSKWNLSSFSSLSHGLQYNVYVSSPATENISSGTSQLLPSLANIALNVALFANLDGFHFPNTFKALQVSYSVMACNPDHSTSKNFSAISCLCSVPNRTCPGSGPKKIKDSPTSQAVLKILVSHRLRTRKIGNLPSLQGCP